MADETGRVLADLGDDWFVLHDLRWPGRRFANIDHVVVGPGGVLVIDSKNWSGTLALNGGVLTQNGRRRERAVAGAADAALAVAELVPAFAHVVQPVLCFVRPEPMRGWSRDVALCSTSTLVELVTTRPVVLDRTQADHLRWTLDCGTRSATTPAPAPAPTRPSSRPRSAGASPVRARPVQRRARPSRRSSGSSGVAQVLAAVVVLVAFFTAGPWFAGRVGPALSDFLREAATQPEACAAPGSARPASARPASARPASASTCPAPTATPDRKPSRGPEEEPAGNRQPVGPD